VLNAARQGMINTNMKVDSKTVEKKPKISSYFERLEMNSSENLGKTGKITQFPYLFCIQRINDNSLDWNFAIASILTR
jgi:hypothetical protein